MLGAPRASNVFNPPARGALSATTWAEAAALNENACGRRISMQTWGIVPKIREVDVFLRTAPYRQQQLREVVIWSSGSSHLTPVGSLEAMSLECLNP